MKAYIECIHDEVLKLSTGRYARMHVIVPQSEDGNYQRYHLGECALMQNGDAREMKAYIESIEDQVMEHSASRYAKLVVTVPEKECGDYQKYHLGECVLLQDDEVTARAGA
jgi:hypothetical protein